MTCSKCGAEVPPGKLVCDCFQAEADNELERKAIERFKTGGALHLSGSGHLMPTAGMCLTLCRGKRFKKISSIPFYKADLNSDTPKGPNLCQLCRRKVEEALKC